MSGNPYRVLGADVPPLIGPRLFGKSVVLNEIAQRFADGSRGFTTAVYSDMRHGTPTTDDAFRAKISAELHNVLKPIRPELAGLLEFDDVPLIERLQTMARDLDEAGDRVLVVMDGFDEVLANPGITAVIWNNLRELSRRPVVRIVSGSRRPLPELCRTEESRTSDFWEIFFHSPVVVGAFDAPDWDALLAPFADRGAAVADDARKALVEWTGGVPVLTAAVLRVLWEQAEPVTAQSVTAVCEEGLEERDPLLEALWEDCTAEMQTDLADLSAGQLRATQVPDRRLRQLLIRGYVRREGKQLKSTCRLMNRFAAAEAPRVDSLQRLFGQDERYERNIRSLLELRLAQVPEFDSALTGYVEQAVRDLTPEPRHSLVWVRSIVDRAFDLIWEAELKDGKTLPAAWLEEWQRARASVPHESGRLPGERGRQMRVLRTAVGTGIRGVTVRRVTRHVSRATALLLEHLQSVGNFGQHQDEEITRAFAVSVCLTAIALCASLAGDLGDDAPAES